MKWPEPGTAEAVPVADAESHPVLHRAAFDNLLRIIVVEGQWIPGLRAFVLDPADFREISGHLGAFS